MKPRDQVCWGELFSGSAETTFNPDPIFERTASGKTGCYELKV